MREPKILRAKPSGAVFLAGSPMAGQVEGRGNWTGKGIEGEREEKENRT